MGGSEAETPVPSAIPPPPGGLRASDAERDEIAGRLRDEYVAGRLSHDTFLHRMDVLLTARQLSDLPPLLDGLPGPPPAPGRPGPRGLAGRLRGAWARWTGQPAAAAPPGTGSKHSGDLRGRTTGVRALGGSREPLPLEFPRGAGPRFIIGRDAGCDLAVADMSVSRRHAILERAADGWLLTDLESTNGTRVNGWRAATPVPVRPGDTVSFGNVEFRFAVSGGTTHLDPPA